MNINWGLIGKIAVSIAIIGFSGTTIVLVARHIKKKRDAKRDAEKQGDKLKENENEEKIDKLEE